MSRRPSSIEDHDRAYRALMDGIRVVEERIAPLWSADRRGMSDRHHIVRHRVTANGFRELDVLLAHWIGLVARRPVRMTEIDGWREAPQDARGAADMIYTPAEILRIAGDYRLAAPPPRMAHGCGMAA